MVPPEEYLEKNPDQNDSLSPSVQSVSEALDEIDRLLHQMLLLAELSASDMDTDRDRLQRTLERLQAKIDRIADSLERANLKMLSLQGRTRAEGPPYLRQHPAPERRPGCQRCHPLPAGQGDRPLPALRRGSSPGQGEDE